MKKVLENIFKWLLLVWISFSIIFTSILSMEKGWGIIESIAYRASNVDGPLLYNMESSEIREWCESYQRVVDEDIENKGLDMEGEYAEKELRLKKIYKKYPFAYAMVISEIAEMETMSDINIISLVMAIVVGTAIYLMLDNDKKRLKVVIIIYILFIFVLGFIEGVGKVGGDDLTLLDRWVFPETYIIPVTGAFSLVIGTRIIRQKKIAKELNEKLKKE